MVKTPVLYEYPQYFNFISNFKPQRPDRVIKKGEKVVAYKFLLIGGKLHTQWPLRLAQALSPVGSLSVFSEEEIATNCYLSLYDLIVIDAGGVENPSSLVANLKETYPAIEVVVVTNSPTWRRARESLQAGALDYIRKSFDEEKIRADFKNILQTLNRNQTKL